jgi:hypothetical protein
MTNPKNRAEHITKANSAKNEMLRLAPVQIPFWHPDMRAIANELTHCALFSCRDKRKPRLYYSNAPLYVLGQDATVTYTGEELRANDEDVWLTLAHQAREQRAGDIIVRVSSSTICKLIGWQTKQYYYTEIFKSIQRLKGATLTIMSRRLTKSRAYEQARQRGASQEELARLYDDLQAYSRGEIVPDSVEVSGLMMSMVGDKVRFSGGGKVVDDIPQGDLMWEVPLGAEMVSLFAKPYLTLIPLETRRKLSPAARRIHAYYMSHAKPHAVLVSSLAGLIGLDSELKEQKRIIRKCLDELVEHHALEKAEMEEGVGDVRVNVVRIKRGASENDPPELENK